MTANANNPAIASRIGLWLGPALAAFVLAMGTPAVLQSQAAFSPAWVTLALLVWMAIWWVTEALPIPVTSLLPLVILPSAGVAPLREISASYMHPVVVLLMGGFIFAKAIERWNLHERIALNVIGRFGTRPSALIAGFMVASALLSMWISNSATSIMMMPIALSLAGSVFAAEDPQEDFARYAFTSALLLGIAYGCSIGGLGTPIGTPTNLIIMGYLTEMGGVEISFTQWMMIGLPTVAIMLPIAWLVLTRWAFKLDRSTFSASQTVLDERKRALGSLATPEKRTIAAFAVIATLWLTGPLYREWSVTVDGEIWQPLAGLSDHVVAIIAVILCFLIPAGEEGSGKGSGKLLNWSTAESIPWGTLLLFGGGLAMAGAINSTGLGAYFGNTLSGLSALPLFLLIILIVAIVLFLTEITSNVATASVVAPILGAMALNAGLPLETILIPIALAASCAFMLPMATGPNAVVFSSGKVSMSTMIRTGFLLNLCAIMALAALGSVLPLFVF